MSDIREGMLVQFIPGLYEDEKGVIYRVLEVNGDRVILVAVNTGLSIPPQSIALVLELERI